jgi:hypothetical protein
VTELFPELRLIVACFRDVGTRFVADSSPNRSVLHFPFDKSLCFAFHVQECVTELLISQKLLETARSELRTPFLSHQILLLRSSHSKHFSTLIAGVIEALGGQSVWHF